MGYQHIPNLSSDGRILELKHVYAMEKLHGTSSHVKFNSFLNHDLSEPQVVRNLTFFSGGEKYENFIKLFDQEKLLAMFLERFSDLSNAEVVVYGEAYGGSQQGMSATYGPNLKFAAFEVKVGHLWLDVPKAHTVSQALGLEFVDYELIPTTQEALDRELYKDSTQAIRNGMGAGKMREGIVLRPPFEIRLNNDARLIAKYKRPEFSERRTVRKPMDPERQAQLTNATTVAFDFVTPMRLEHVINRLISEREDKSYSIKDTGKLIELMVEDVEREREGAFEPSAAIRKAIGSMTVKLFKKKLDDNVRATILKAQNE